MNPNSSKTKPVSSTATDILRGAFYFFLAVGILALGYSGYVSASSRSYQALEMRKFKEADRISEPHLLTDGDVLGEIQVPRLGLEAIVVQGDSPAILRRAVGHLSRSALPGELGNVALAGHRDTFFRPLRDIRLGDVITFKTQERSFEYLVQSIEVVAPTDIRVLEPSTGHDLTLLTCYPVYYVGPAPKRLAVRAREVEGIVREQITRTTGSHSITLPASFQAVPK
jgi:LPXTG-site transpeptidase (sortase) family protein